MLTTEQAAELKTAMLADAALAQWRTDRRDDLIAAYYNEQAAPAFYVWRSVVSTDEVIDAILWDRMTPVDTPDGTAIQTNRLLLCQAKQMNLQVLLQGRESINTGRANLRALLSDALLNVPSGAGGATQDAGWIGVGRVKATISRLVTRAERLFATGTGAAGTPGSLVFEGSITTSDISAMLN